MPPSLCVRTRWLRASACLLLALIPPGLRAAKPAWKPVPPAELAETEPKLEPEAPAEALLVQMEVDDRNFPRERVITEYLRYKIFAPDRVENITRISGIDNTAAQSRTELHARLILPDGRMQEFGQESIQERTLSKKAQEGGFLGWLAGSGDEIKERFLAVSGVEPGAVLEYHITRRFTSPPIASSFTAQREGIPVRELVYTFRVSPETEYWGHQLFVSNQHGAEMKPDPKKRLVTVTAKNLPSLVREPFLGPFTDYALTAVHTYHAYTTLLLPRSGKVPVPGTIDAKLGPWAPTSTMMNWFERDRGYVTPRVKQVAAEITAEAPDDTAKARAIHRYVQNLWQKYRVRPGPRPPQTQPPDSLDDIIDWEKKPEVIRLADEFLWLAIALNKSAGIEAHTLLLPNRLFTRFNPKNVSSAFLPARAVALHLDDQWVYSYPHAVNRIPFGMLPWEHEGMPALLALDRKQDFLNVPTAAPDKSSIASLGKFKLSASGMLTGECTRSFTGHAATMLRGQLRRTTLKTRRDAIIRGKLGLDAKVAEITVTKLEGLDDPEKPLVATCRIRWPNFATRVKDRLVLKPSVFRVEGGSPFTATERRHPVHFPYRWREIDQLTIEMPAGFEPEAPTAPAPSKGEILSQETQISYDRKNNTVHLARTFTSNALDVPVEHYPVLKSWYDRVARTDQHEIIFNRRLDAAGGK